MHTPATAAVPAFVVQRTPTVAWPVTLSLPADGGRLAEVAFTGIFRVLSEDEHEAIAPSHLPPADAASADADTAPARPVQRPWREVLAENAALLPRYLTDWKGVLDEHGQPVPVSELPALLQGPHGKALSVGLVRAIAEVRWGVAAQPGGALAGNSQPARDAGSSAPAVSAPATTSSPAT
jgi:hypothetical protein